MKRHLLLNKIATISLIVLAAAGFIAGFVLAFSLKSVYREEYQYVAYLLYIPAVSGGSLVLSVPGIFILLWIRKDYYELNAKVSKQ